MIDTVRTNEQTYRETRLIHKHSVKHSGRVVIPRTHDNRLRLARLSSYCAPVPGAHLLPETQSKLSQDGPVGHTDFWEGTRPAPEAIVPVPMLQCRKSHGLPYSSPEIRVQWPYMRPLSS